MPPFNPDSSNFSWLVGTLIELIDSFVLVLFALTFVVILWQIINAWIIHGGDAGKIKDANATIFYGVIVLAVMAAVWGIVALLQSAII